MLNAELKSMNSILTFQHSGKSQVEGGGNCIIRRAVWTVCKLEQIECVGEAGFDFVHD